MVARGRIRAARKTDPSYSPDGANASQKTFQNENRCNEICRKSQILCSFKAVGICNENTNTFHVIEKV